MSEVAPLGPFSLDAALRFLDSFAPAGAAGQGATYAAAHVVDGAPVVVRVTDAGGGRLDVTPGAAVPLVRRMFCLDWDGEAFAALEDPVVAALRRAYPGLRPVLFASPWEALAWAVIGHRVPMAQAARLKDALRDELGPEVEGARAFPPPEAVLAHGAPGLPAIKAERLKALAARAAAGELDAERLRAMEPDAARAWLERSPGIGPWSSAFVLIRAVGFTDLLPTAESRLAASVAAHYGLSAAPTDEELAAIAAAWSPFRAWAAFLLRVDAR